MVRLNVKMMIALTLLVNLLCLVQSTAKFNSNEIRMDHLSKYQGYAPKQNQMDFVLTDLQNKLKFSFDDSDLKNTKSEKVEISH